MLDKEFLDILVCPLDKAAVKQEGEELVCAECGRRYPIKDGIPVMLPEEAKLPEEKPKG